MKKIWLSVLICSLFAFPAFSLPLESLVPPDTDAQLRSGGEIIIQTQLKNPTPLLIPADSEVIQFVTSALSSLNPNMLVEALYLYDKSAPQTESGKWSSAQRTGVFNQTLALSTLTGIQYYSASRGAMRTFYDYSSVIDSPSAKNPLPDPVFTDTLPASLSIYARQRDLTFGDNIYRYDYAVTEGAILFVQENVTALNYGIIQAVGKGKLRSVLAVIDCGDSILIYAASMAKAASLPGMQTRVSNSFSNRAEAVLKWFTGRLAHYHY